MPENEPVKQTKSGCLCDTKSPWNNCR